MCPLASRLRISKKEERKRSKCKEICCNTRNVRNHSSSKSQRTKKSRRRHPEVTADASVCKITCFPRESKRENPAPGIIPIGTMYHAIRVLGPSGFPAALNSQAFRRVKLWKEWQPATQRKLIPRSTATMGGLLIPKQGFPRYCIYTIRVHILRSAPKAQITGPYFRPMTTC